MAKIYLETFINAPIERVFDLARSIDIHKLSAKKTGEEVIAGRTSGLVNLNDQITWQARHFGITQKLSVIVTQSERPKLFVDKMIKGIFSYMEHSHIFEESGEQTRMTDIFEFKAPLGVLGRFAELLFLEAYMRKFISAKNKKLKSIAEGDTWQHYLELN